MEYYSQKKKTNNNNQFILFFRRLENLTVSLRKRCHPPPPAKHVTVVSSVSLLLFIRPSTIYCHSRFFVRRTLSVFSPCVRPSEIIARHRRGEIPRGTTTIIIVIIIYASGPLANTSPRRIYVRCRRRNAIIYQGDRGRKLGRMFAKSS